MTSLSHWSRTLFSAMFAAVLFAVITGCASTRTAESTGEYIDDTALTTKVKAALLNDAEVSGSAINVETFKGTVQLSGFAKTQAERQRAYDLALKVKGVSSVKNNILIK